MFHSGVLLRLADDGLLERVCGISTVSGGSLGIALVVSRAVMKWPRSDEYRAVIFPELRKSLASIDLLTLGIGLKCIAQYGHRLLTARTSILSDCLVRPGHHRKDRPAAGYPVLGSNTTSLQTRKALGSRGERWATDRSDGSTTCPST